MFPWGIHAHTKIRTGRITEQRVTNSSHRSGSDSDLCQFSCTRVFTILCTHPPAPAMFSTTTITTNPHTKTNSCSVFRTVYAPLPTSELLRVFEILSYVPPPPPPPPPPPKKKKKKNPPPPHHQQQQRTHTYKKDLLQCLQEPCLLDTLIYTTPTPSAK